jgi:hypothetical protein
MERDSPLNGRESLSNSICEHQTNLAEGALSSLIAAMTKLYGPKQARPSAENWLEESELMERVPI